MIRSRQTARAAVAALALSLAYPPGLLAEDSSPGSFEPTVHGDASLDESLAALNDALQAHYAFDDMLAALHAEPTDDFADIAEATGAVPEMVVAAAESEFGVPVSDGASLNESMRVLNSDLLMRAEPLFVQLARQETQKGLDFEQVAGSVAAHNAIERLSAAAGATNEWGEPVSDDRSLDQHLAAFAQMLAEIEARETMLAQAVPAVNGASFDRYMLALAELN